MPSEPPEDQRLPGPHGDAPETQLHAAARVRADCTRSWSPTEAPPRVTSTSASRACGPDDCRFQRLEVVACDAKIEVLPPAGWTMPEIAEVLEATIWSGR